MWLTRFQDRSSVRTKTKFGRGAGGGCAPEEVQPDPARTAHKALAITKAIFLLTAEGG
jgi:hypothetical protein